MYTYFIQLVKKANQPRIGVLKAWCIDKLNTILFAIVVDASIVCALEEACQLSFSIILNDLIIYVSTTMSTTIKAVVTKMYFVTILTKSFHLIVYLL